MTFNYQNSALRFLNDISPNQLGIYPKSSDQAIHFILDRLPEFRPAFRERVQYAGIPFIMKSNEGFRRLKAVLPREPIVQSGTWMMPFDKTIWTFFYCLDLHPGVTVKWKGDVTVLIASNHLSFDNTPMVSVNVQHIEELTESRYSDLESAMQLPLIVGNLFNLIVFSRYCDWETHFVPPGRSATHLQTEYLNESAFQIEVFDSPWFTQLMEDKDFAEGSPKGGFFRLQRYGPNRAQQKLLWVAPKLKTALT